MGTRRSSFDSVVPYGQQHYQFYSSDAFLGLYTWRCTKQDLNIHGVITIELTI